MRIVYLHQYFNTPAMPGSTRSYEMARRLVERGHEVHMVTSDRSGVPGGGWRESDEGGIRVHWTAVPYSNRLRYAARIRAFLAFAMKAAARATALEPDVVFASSTPLTIVLPAVRAARRNRVPMVLELRDLWPKVPIALGALRDPASIWVARALERYAYRHSARIVVLAPGMADWVAGLGYPRVQISVIPNGCDLELFGGREPAARELRASHHWLGDRPLVLYAGTLGLVNGVSYLAQVAGHVALIDPEIRFLVLGEGRESDSVRTAASAAGVLDTSFRMLGAVPKTEAADWMAASTVCIALGIDEPFVWENAVANKFFDALAAGRPILANHPGFQSELAEDAGAGVTLPRDPAQAAAELARRVRDDGWLESAGAAARRLAEERFDRDKLALELESVLLDAVEEARR